MSDNQMRKAMAVGLTGLVVILFAILNMLAPIFGSVAILAAGVIWVALVNIAYSEE
jgi:hypothetical protein